MSVLSRRRNFKAKRRDAAYLRLVDNIGHAHSLLLHMPVSPDNRAEELLSCADAEMVAAMGALKDLGRAL